MNNFINYTICILLWIEILVIYKKNTKTSAFLASAKNKWIVSNACLLTLFILSSTLTYFISTQYFKHIHLYNQIFSILSVIFVFAILKRPKFKIEPEIQQSYLTLIVSETSSIENELSENELVLNDKKVVSSKFKLNDELITAYIGRIHQHMTHNKPYLKHGYSMDDLSHELNIPKHHLTFTIKQLEKNFNDCINKYRIAFAVELLKTKDNNLYSLEAIAHKSGFTSMPTFIKAFRKETNAYPSEYRKKYQRLVS
jgi:AraC-like DNA-binding protein